MVFLYYVGKKNKQNYLKRLETDVEFAILFIASEIIGAIEIISILLLFAIFFELSIEYFKFETDKSPHPSKALILLSSDNSFILASTSGLTLLMILLLLNDLGM